MLRILFVDDEELELRALEQACPWESFDIQVAGSLTGGEQALALCAESPPDIVLTDLRMPGIDGMELARALKRLSPQIHILFISAYEDFTVAQCALEIGVDGYLLKPLDPMQLFSLIQKIFGLEMEKQIQRARDDRLARMVQAAKPLLQEWFWLDLLQDRRAAASPTLGERAQTVGIAFRNYQYVVFCCRVHACHPAALTAIELRSLLLKVSSALTPYAPVRIDSSLYAIILPFSLLLDDAMINESVERKADTLLTLEAAAGSGRAWTLGASLPGELKDISLLFGQAAQALSLSFQFGRNKLYWYEEPAAVPDDNSLDLGQVLGQLESALAETDLEHVGEVVDELFAGIRQCSQEHVQAICFEIISRAINQAAQSGIDTDSVMGSPSILWQKLLHMDTILDIHQWMRNVLCMFGHARRQQRKNAGQSCVDAVLDIIQSEYMRDLSIGELAARTHFAQGYLCRVFKNRTGDSILTALLKKRMQAAGELLKMPNSRVSEVAAAVGFSSSSYFVKVFRDYYGITPGEYRR